MPSLIHRVSGSPHVDGCADVPIDACWFCGGSSNRSMPTKAWIKDGFTNGNRVRAPDSDRVCEGCVFVCSRISPVPGRPPAAGKKFGGNFRNYSHCIEVRTDGRIEYLNATKAENERVRDFLRRPKTGDWFCAVAQSGQKHCIPWAPKNGPGIAGCCSFDDALVSVPASDRQWELFDDVEALLDVGVPRGAVQDGRWPSGVIAKHRDALRAFDEKWSRHRGSGWFSLVTHLAKKTKGKD